MMFERKEIEFKNLRLTTETEHGSFQGYGNVVNIVDAVDEMSLTGAFVEGIINFIKNGWIAIGHDWGSLPIATVQNAYEDSQGLFFQADFHSTAQAQDARTVMKERAERGKSVRFSIGYEVLEDEWDKEKNIRLLKKIKVFEISYVNLPANEQSLMTGIKSGSTYSEQYETALAVVSDFANRSKSLLEIRMKDGRVLSAANREKLTTLKTSLSTALAVIDDVIALSEPKPKEEDETSKSLLAMSELYMQFRHNQLQRIR